MEDKISSYTCKTTNIGAEKWKRKEIGIGIAIIDELTNDFYHKPNGLMIK